ncbi:MAG: DoxX family protein [Acidobacteria bacterium]|nr:DoxX family protein [Acidobacteriota bacterium]
MKYDQSELAFRVLFSLIFLGLGMEHLFSDAVIRAMMPDWIIGQRWVSLASGAILLTGGSLILLGYRMRLGALLLGGFLLLVTAVIHGPNLIVRPSDLPHEWGWLWDVYQRSNFFKNLCLLGGCFYFYNHEPGRYSLHQLKNKASAK